MKKASGKSSAPTNSKAKHGKLANSMRRPFKEEQKKTVEASGNHAIKNLKLETKELLKFFREVTLVAHSKVTEWFEDSQTRWIEGLSMKERAAEISKAREVFKLIDETDEQVLETVAASKISKEKLNEVVLETFGTPPMNEKAANYVLTVYDPRPESASENERVSGVVTFPQLNPKGSSEFEFAPPETFGVMLTLGDDGKPYLVMGDVRTYGAAIKIGRISISKTSAALAVTLFMLKGDVLGIPEKYHLLNEDGESRTSKIRELYIYGPSMVIECVKIFTEQDVADISRIPLRDLIGPDSKAEQVQTFRAAMRRAYLKLVEAGEIQQSNDVEGSTDEDPLPENGDLWKLISSPALCLLLPSCVWAGNCYNYNISTSEPVVVEDVCAAIKRAVLRVKNNRENESSMTDDNDPDFVDLNDSKSKGKGKGKGKGRSSSSGRSRAAVEEPQIDLIDPSFLDTFGENLMKCLKHNFAASALRMVREEKGMPSKSAIEAYKKATVDKPDTLVLNSAVCESDLTPQERGFYLALLDKAPEKVKSQMKMAETRGKTDPVIGALFKKLRPNEVGTDEKLEVPVRAIVQTLITSGMQSGKLALKIGKQQNADITKKALSLVSSLGEVVDSINGKIEEANSSLENFAKSEKHLQAQLKVSKQEASKLRDENAKLNNSHLEIKCKIVKAEKDLEEKTEEIATLTREKISFEKQLAEANQKIKELQEAANSTEKAANASSSSELRQSCKKDMSKCANEAPSDEETSDSDGDPDPSDAVFGLEPKESTATALSNMVGKETEAKKQAENEERCSGDIDDEEEGLEDDDFSREERGTKRKRDDKPESRSKTQKTTSQSNPKPEERDVEIDLDGW